MIAELIFLVFLGCFSGFGDFFCNVLVHFMGLDADRDIKMPEGGFWLKFRHS